MKTTERWQTSLTQHVQIIVGPCARCGRDVPTLAMDGNAELCRDCIGDLFDGFAKHDDEIYSEVR